MWKGVLLLLLYGGLIGGAAWISLELTAGVAVLLGLLHVLVSTIWKNSERVRLEEERAKPHLERRTAPKRSAVSPSPRSEAEVHALAGLDKNIFAKFQQNLGQTTSGPVAPVEAPAPVPPLPPKSLVNRRPLPPKAQADFQDELLLQESDAMQVRLQTKATPPKPAPSPSPVADIPPKSSPASVPPKPSASASSPSKTEPMDSPQRHLEILRKLAAQSLKPNEPEDLFADVQVALAGDHSANPPKAKPEASKNKPLPDIFDEGLGAALQQKTTNQDKQSEASALFKMAAAAFQAGHPEEARASLDNYWGLLRDLKIAPTWDAQYLYARVCLKQGETSTAVEYVGDILKTIGPQHTDYLRILEEFTRALEGLGRFADALPFLQELLNHYRHQVKRAEMDQVYERIETAMESLGDDERLVRTYKNHLEIKKILKDKDGESRLLDLLGNRYYKLGQKELSQQYYEENLRLKASLAKSSP